MKHLVLFETFINEGNSTSDLKNVPIVFFNDDLYGSRLYKDIKGPLKDRINFWDADAISPEDLVLPSNKGKFVSSKLTNGKMNVFNNFSMAKPVIKELFKKAKITVPLDVDTTSAEDLVLPEVGGRNVYFSKDAFHDITSWTK